MTQDKGRGRPPYADILTPAEWQVAEGVRHGLTNPAIALRLGVSLDAVKFHVGHVLHKLGLANRVELRSWDGVRSGSNLQKRRMTMLPDLKLEKVGQVSRTVKDVKAARLWFGDVLGLPHLYSFGDLAFFDCGGLRLFLSEGDPSSGDSILYFRVADVHCAHASLSQRGVEFVSAPHLIHKHADGTEEWMAFFNDLDGRPLGLMSQETGQ